MKQNSERIIGIHARITDSLLALAHRALHLKIPIFQIFLMDQTTRRMFTFTNEEIAQFRILREAPTLLILQASITTAFKYCTKKLHLQNN